ncbi:AAA family ATPase [Pelosinus sp. UFO1]|uniref:AAA family ATPase n=1 Tax=Pelosinus sp. UFO1 TaxID=484770 RepID=UPI0004D175AC|nr:AAA family ATPase [Pelosinus sp. UFO1]AIF50279.1 hypothetical protein UFO1_0724 [Pelosinus sp. UFO1]
MNKKLILLAGYPGTGKTYLCNIILEWRNCFVVLSPDDIKEKFWDELGFDSLEEKEKTIQLSWDYYYKKMKEIMQGGSSIISDYPFSEKHKSKIELLSEQYGYQIVTIRLTGDLDVLFERQKKRDLDTNRHLGHILNCYHYGEHVKNRSEADGLVDYKEFTKRCRTRGYGNFELGHLIEMDMTDFSSIDYSELLRQLKKLE